MVANPIKHAPTNVEYRCNQKLGVPKLVDCLNAEFRIKGHHNLLVGPSNPFFLNSGMPALLSGIEVSDLLKDNAACLSRLLPWSTSF